MCCREQDGTFVATRRQHPAVETPIDNLMELSIVVLNIHRIGPLAHRKAKTGISCPDSGNNRQISREFTQSVVWNAIYPLKSGQN